MPESLASAQVIGGISVEIGASIAGLRAGVAEAKTIAATAEKQIRINVPLLIAPGSEAKLRAELKLLTSSIGQGLAIRIPVTFYPAGGGSAAINSGGQLALPGGGGFGSGGAKFVASRVIDSSTGGGPSIGAGPAGGIVDGQLVSSRWGGQLALPGGGGASGGGGFNGGGGTGGAAAAGWFSRNLPGLGKMGRLGRVATAGILAYEGLRVGSAYDNLITAKASANSGEEQLAAEQSFSSSIESVPIVGQLAGLYVDNSSLFTGDAKNRYRTGRDAKIEIAKTVQDARRRDMQTERMVARGENNHRIVHGAEALTLGYGGRAQQALDEFDASGPGDTPAARAARKALGGQVVIGRGFDSLQAAGRGLINGANSYQIGAINAGVAGRTRSAMFQEYAGQRQQIEGEGKLSLVGVQRPEDIAQIKKGTQAKLDLAEAQYHAQVVQDKKQREIDADTAIDAKREASLRIGKKTYAADLDAFDSATKAKIKSITDLDAKQNESSRRAAQRSVIVAQQTEQIAQANGAMQLSGEVAVMSASGDRIRAARKNLVGQRALGRASVDAKLQPAYDEETKQLVAALDMDQARVGESHQLGFESRRQMAGASGRGLNRLSGVFGTIGSMKQEVVGADKSDLSDIISTQKAELGSIQSMLLRPTRYAREVNRGFDAPGGPDGKSGSKEIVEILKAIKDYLGQLQNARIS